MKSMIRVGLLMALLLAGLLLVPAASAEDPPACHGRVERLAEEMGVDCQVLLDLHAEEVGYGQIMQAWQLSQGLPDFEGTWDGLLEAHQEGQGWGQLVHAHSLAQALGDETVDAERLLELKEGGLGWGELGHAYALAGAEGLSFEEAAALLQQYEDWDDLRQYLGLEEGPPPWAGGPSHRGENGTGPPFKAPKVKKEKPELPPQANGRPNDD